MGWAKENLSKGNREQIAGSLFTVKDKNISRNKGWLNGLCPLHDDTNASFGYNVVEDVFHCQADCSKDGDLIDLYCRVNGLDAAAGFIEFKKSFGNDLPVSRPPKEPGKTGQKKKDDKPPVDFEQMADAYESFPELPDAWLARLLEVRGWKKETCKALGLKKQTKYRDKNTGTLKNVSHDYSRVAIPVFDKDGKLQNIRLYKPNATEAKIISWGAGTGTNRLFPWPEKDQTGTAWICEGEADTICARSLGLEAYTQTAKRKNWPDDQVEPFRDRDVVICYDADLPGANYASTAANCLAKVTRSVRVLEWPGFMRDENGEYPEKHGQDLTDFIVTHGKTLNDLENLLPDAKEFREQDYDTAWQFFGQTLAGRNSFQPRLLAERLLRDVDLLNDPMTGLLYRWNGQHYEVYQEDSLKKRAIRYLGNESIKSRYCDAVDQARILATIQEGKMVNDNADLLCLKSGMLDTINLQLLNHAKKYYATFQIPVNFDPDNLPRPPERWLQYLLETIQTKEAIEQLQEFFGLCLTRDMSYQISLFMIGDGGDGKSVALEILEAMVGEENCAAVSFDGLEDQFRRVALYNKMVNISSEIGSLQMDSQYFKKVNSGDPIDASFKHKNSFKFKPFCKLVYAVNKMPKITDNTDGLYRRILMIHFKRQFLLGDPNRDPKLKEKLLAELDGIFAWGITGLLRLRDRGYIDVNVEETQALLNNYRRQNSPIFTFVQDCCVLGSDSLMVSRASLYKAYRTWCGENGFGAVHSQNFFGDLRRAIKTLNGQVQNSRPRVDGKPTRSLKGIGLMDLGLSDPS